MQISRAVFGLIGLLESIAVHAEGVEPLTPSTTINTAVDSATAFNPKLSLILDGGYHHQGAVDVLKVGSAFAAHDDDVHVDPDNGLTVGESELVLSATIDPYFDGFLNMAFEGDTVEVEEAWAQTRLLPNGLRLKMGRFLSGVGYRNAQHAHAWDLADASLPTVAFLGEHGLNDNGVQVTWLPDLPMYVQLGAEVLQGHDQTRFAVQADDDSKAGFDRTVETQSGPRVWTAFANVAHNLTIGYDNHALQLGAWLAQARQFVQVSGDDDSAVLLAGDQQLYGLSAVYKWDSPKPAGQGDVKVVAEWMYAHSQAGVVGTGTAVGKSLGQSVDQHQQGYTLEALWGVAPRWQLATRWDGLSRARLQDGAESVNVDASQRATVALNYLPSEFSRLRLQASVASLAQVEPLRDARWARSVLLQYTFSLGPHGAHAF
jgi:hypothetical protein